MSLHLITDGKLSLKNFAKIARQIDSDVTYFHIREKQKSAAEIVDGIHWLLEAGISKQKIIVNDRVDISFAFDLAGVQLGYHSLPLKIVRSKFPTIKIGCSTHSLEEVKAAEAGGANFAFFGHIFPSSSKQGLEPRGCKQLERIARNVSIPIIAIGGITPDNTQTILNHGASGIAVISGILGASDIQRTAGKYSEILTRWKEEKHEALL